jgi:sucrose-phosphate synthase
MDSLDKVGNKVGFGVATGRRLESTIQILKEWKVPIPDLIISSVGSEIHYGPVIVEDSNWSKHISYNWKPLEIHKMVSTLPGLVLQPDTGQRKHKISYYIDPEKSPSIKDIIKYLRRNDIKTNVIFSHGEFIDFLPIRASKGQAVRHFALKWGIAFDRILVAGDSGNDGEMLKGNTLAVIVGNYSSELEKLKGATNIYFADGHYAKGISQGIDYYDFFGQLRIPEEVSQPDEYSD